MELDPRFVDVEFPADPNYVMGSLMPDDVERFCASMPVYEDAIPPIPSSEWKGIVEAMEAEGGGNERLVTRIYNQKSEGSCVANACSQAHENVQARQFGLDKVVHLSAISLYKRIGRSPGSGAMVSDGLEEMSSRGILPLDTPENRARFAHVMPNTGFYERYPDGWEATAANFKLIEWHVVKTYEGLVTAGLRQEGAVVGRAGHSIYYCRPTFKGNDLYYGYANSWGGGPEGGGWGSPWGSMKSGFGFDSSRLIRSSAGWAFVPRAVVVPSDVQIV